MKAVRQIPQLGILCAVGLFLFSLTSAPAKLIRLRTISISTASNSAPLFVQATNTTAPVSGLFLIQFTGPIQPEWRPQLAGLGVDLLTYVPDDTFVARLENVSPAAVRRLAFVQWLGDFRAEYKRHPALSGAPAAIRLAAAPLMEVKVLLAPRAPAAEMTAVRALFAGGRAETAHRFGTILQGQVPTKQIGALADSRAVLWLEPAAKMQLLDETAAKIVAGNGGTNRTFTQTLGYTGTNVIVAVADSGLDTGLNNSMHPDLAGRVAGLLYYGSLTSAADELGHGTPVTGMLAGNGATGETDANGALYGLGVAPGAKVLVQRIYDAYGNEETPAYATLTGDAVTNGAVVGLNSWGHDSSGGTYDLAAATFDELVRDANPNAPGDQPYTLIFAAGNDGWSGPQNIFSPAVGKNVIAVGACQGARMTFPSYNSGPEVVADFSSIGPTADGRIKPDLVAPGAWIASAWSSIAPLIAPDLGQQMIDSNYAYQSGTSMAAPQVAGAAAVFVQYYRATHTNATPSPALIKAALVNCAHALDLQQGNAPAPNMTEGWGRVNVAGLFATNRSYDLFDQSVWLTNAQTWSRPLVVNSSGQPLKITLAYTDVPGVPYAASALVNDLDLILTGPDGHSYRGNRFDGSGVSVPDPANPDNLNNVEGIYLPTPAPGLYTVSVSGRSVVADFDAATNTAPRQDFALVTSGDLLAGFASSTNSFSPNLAIPDGNLQGVNDVRTVTTAIHSLVDLKVKLKIVGTYNGDLFCSLRHGSGYTVLLNRPGRRAGNSFGYGDQGFDMTFAVTSTNGDAHVYRQKLFGNNNVPLTGPLTGTWVPDGRATDPRFVLDTDLQTLSLNSLKAVDPNGQWTLTVADVSAGDLSTLVSWGLEFTGPNAPIIIQQPASQTVPCSVSNAVFTVIATNSSPVSYRWYFNAAPLAGAVNSTMILTNATAANVGNYYAVITNANGAVTSTVVTLGVIDTTPPVVTLLGANPQTVTLHGAFTDAGATATDTCAGALPVVTNGTVNVNTLGTYLIKYLATDPNGNVTTNTRTVNVVNAINLTPVITSCYRGTGSFVVNGHGAAGTNYGLLVITNLFSGANLMTNWTTVASTLADTNGIFQLIDSNAPASARRFYRVSSQ